MSDVVERIEAKRASLAADLMQSASTLDPAGYVAADRARRDFEELRIYGPALAARPTSDMLVRRAAADGAMFEAAYRMGLARPVA